MTAINRGSFSRSHRVGLALGGGAARGLALIGVLKALEEEGIPVDYVAGTSVGSLVGAALCAGLSWQEILERARGIDWSVIASPILPRMGLLNMNKLQRLIEDTVGDRTFESLAIPFCAVVTDITTGEQVILSEGPVGRAVRASCSIPGFFEPVAIDGRSLVDGGLVNNVPVNVVRNMGADIVIGVSLHGDRSHAAPPRNVFEVLFYSFDILMKSNESEQIAMADVVVAPELDGFPPWSFRGIDEMVALGESAMRMQMGRLRALLPAEHGHLHSRQQPGLHNVASNRERKREEGKEPRAVGTTA